MSPRSERPGSAPPCLVLQLFGGFAAAVEGTPARQFESKKSRALLAYLALQESHGLARDRLAAIFWPDLEPEGARRNLRQAIYGLRSALGRAEVCLIADASELRLDLERVEVDVVRFEALARLGLEGRGPASVAALDRALGLYRGELLSGLAVRESEAYEEWRARERERLRELAMAVAREALRRSEGDGLHETALRFARRLGELEPLSEEACRSRMRLLARLGRRAQALAEFGEFAALLERELGVEAGAETRALQEAILADDELPPPEAEAAGPTGPVVPLVGRDKAWRELAAVWGEVRGGEPRVTLVVGGRGTGKSRLIRSFVRDALGESGGAVLLARCAAGESSSLRAALADAVASLPLEVTERTRPELVAAVAGAVAALPEVAERRRDLTALAATAPPSTSAARSPQRVLAALLVQLTKPPRGGVPGRGAPAILFVDDLEQSPAVLEGLIEIRHAVGKAPVWVVAAARSDDLGAPAVAALRSAVEPAGGDFLELGWLQREDLLSAARALVGERGAEELATALFAASAGLPLALAEAVNLLADEGLLRRGERGRWLIADLEGLAKALPVGLEPLVQRRMAGLPKTSRRMLGLAAVAGERFDTATLLEVDREHPAVLEAALQILVERWMVRPLLRSWAAHRRDRDMAIWNAGARHGPFEFAQSVVRDLLYAAVDPARRRVLHAAIARAIASQGDEARLDELALHWRLAGELAPAVESLAAAAERLHRFGDLAGAEARLSDARLLLDLLRRAQGTDPEETTRLAQRLAKQPAAAGEKPRAKRRVPERAEG